MLLRKSTIKPLLNKISDGSCTFADPCMYGDIDFEGKVRNFKFPASCYVAVGPSITLQPAPGDGFISLFRTSAPTLQMWRHLTLRDAFSSCDWRKIQLPENSTIEQLKYWGQLIKKTYDCGGTFNYRGRFSVLICLCFVA